MSSAAVRPAVPARIDAPTAARLAVLAAAAFVYVTFEVFPVGLIKDIAASLQVTAGQVGLLIAGYAVVAGAVTIPAVAFAARVSRRTALVGSLAVLVAAELLAAASTNFTMMALSRAAAALTHGVLWSLIAPAAASLAPRERVGTATAMVFGGATLAAIVGSPGTTLVGELIGWRATALALAAATVVVTVALARLLRLPDGPGPGTAARAAPVGAESSGAVNWAAVLALCTVAVVLVTAHFVSYTYFAIIVGDVIGKSAVVVMLSVFGLAGAVGTYLVGRYNDGDPRRTATVTMVAFLVGVSLLAVAMLALPRLVSHIVIAVGVAVWGAAFAAAGPVFQTGIMRLASGAADRASAVYVTGFQVGIAGGSGLGAALLGRSAAWHLPVVSTVCGAVVLAAVLTRRQALLAGRGS